MCAYVCVCMCAVREQEKAKGEESRKQEQWQWWSTTTTKKEGNGGGRARARQTLLRRCGGGGGALGDEAKVNLSGVQVGVGAALPPLSLLPWVDACWRRITLTQERRPGWQAHLFCLFVCFCVRSLPVWEPIGKQVNCRGNTEKEEKREFVQQNTTESAQTGAASLAVAIRGLCIALMLVHRASSYRKHSEVRQRGRELWTTCKVRTELTLRCYVAGRNRAGRD